MQDPSVPEPAVAVGEDPRDYARLMSAVYDATMAGTRAPARPRSVIEDSWQRLMANGLDPDRLAAPVVELAGLEMLRRSSGLLGVLDEVSRNLETLIAEGDNILVIADARGRVLWRSGSASVLNHADRLGFIEGAHWDENAVGTNAIGTALASNRLRSVAAPILARIGAPALAVDHDGWVAAVDSLPLHNRILLPEDTAPGRAWISPLGMCEVELLPGGWLVRPIDDDAAPGISRVTLDLRDSGTPSLEMVGQFGCWRSNISPRHAEILLVLATHRDGRSAPDLADDLYGDRTRVVTVRAEMSRLRRQLAGLVHGRPYRFPPSAVVDVCYPTDIVTLLAASTAPAIRALRRT